MIFILNYFETTFSYFYCIFTLFTLFLSQKKREEEDCSKIKVVPKQLYKYHFYLNIIENGE